MNVASRLAMYRVFTARSKGFHCWPGFHLRWKRIAHAEFDGARPSAANIRPSGSQRTTSRVAAVVVGPVGIDMIRTTAPEAMRRHSGGAPGPSSIFSRRDMQGNRLQGHRRRGHSDFEWNSLRSRRPPTDPGSRRQNKVSAEDRRHHVLHFCPRAHNCTSPFDTTCANGEGAVLRVAGPKVPC